MTKLDSSQEHKDGPTYSISMIYHIDNRSKGKNTHIIISIDAQKAFNKIQHHYKNPTSNAEEAEVERFYEDLQDLLELIPPKNVLFIIGDWNAKVGSQETPRVTGKFGLGVRNEAGQRLIEFCQENALIITNTLFQ